LFLEMMVILLQAAGARLEGSLEQVTQQVVQMVREVIG
jgi:hypothetical protein